MLSIKHLYNQIFGKHSKNNEENINFDNDILVMSVGLTPNYEIDLSIEVKDLHISNQTDLNIKAEKIATFLYGITSGNLNQTIVEFLMNILSDEESQKLFEAILYRWLLLEKNQNNTNINNEDHKEIALIQPSKVFNYYINMGSK